MAILDNQHRSLGAKPEFISEIRKIANAEVNSVQNHACLETWMISCTTMFQSRTSSNVLYAYARTRSLPLVQVT